MTGANLIRDVIRGKARAQSEFYDTYSPLVMGICVRYFGQSEEANDVFQESFIKVFGQLTKLKDQEAIHGWIKRIVVNTALNHLRDNKRMLVAESGAEIMDDDSYPEIMDHLTNEALLKLIEELPQGYRVVFNLHVIDGYNHKEIAKQLGISESTSRSQLTHAKRVLRKSLHQLGVKSYEKVI